VSDADLFLLILDAESKSLSAVGAVEEELGSAVIGSGCSSTVSGSLPEFDMAASSVVGCIL
jgi:hypothetical protein